MALFISSNIESFERPENMTWPPTENETHSSNNI
jgi:hypothetical protein